MPKLHPLRRLAALLAPFALAALAAGCAEGRAIEPVASYCGDGVVDEGEQCDDGAENADRASGTCRTTCLRPFCGDRVVDPGEDCDDGNDVTGDGCDRQCRNAYVCGDAQCSDTLGESCSVCEEDCCPCGDGVCTLGELCGACPADCCPDCGNGVLDGGEACDDGNNDEGDGCGIGCEDEDGVATCGNGLIEAGEECEDGNTEPNDGCSPECLREYVCGDNVCETGVGENCVLCPMDCCPNCGDGVLNDFEECDGALPTGTPTCLDLCYQGGIVSCTSCLIDYGTCQGGAPACGNGVAECGETCDGDDLAGATCDALGFDGGGLACSAGCGLDVSGCGERLHYYRESFDDGCPADWSIGYPWACGVPTGGPGAAFSPPNALATGLAGGYPGNQLYGTATVTSPPFDLSDADNPTVAFRTWHDLEQAFDSFQVSASIDGVTFSPITSTVPAYGAGQGWTGASSGWKGYVGSLAGYVGQPQVWVRFALQSNSSVQLQGVFLDDFLVAEACGNGVVDPGEVCDGANLGAAVCPDGTCGSPTCAADCQSADVASCLTPECGNGVRECDEACDAPDFDGLTCDDIGHDGGTLACTGACTYDVAACGELLRLLDPESFETCPPPGWTLSGAWQCGVPTSGPGAANTGSQALATNLSGDYPSDCEYDVDYVETPPFYVAGDGPLLAFYGWLRSENSYDGMHLEVSTNGGQSWSLLTGVTPAYTDDSVGSSSAWDDSLTSWQLFTADLSPYLGETVRVRFGFSSDFTVEYAGAYVDDVVAVPSLELLPVLIAPVSAPSDVFVGQALTLPLSTVSPGAVVWSIDSQTNGAWLSVDPGTGVLSGMATVAEVGSVSVTLRAERPTDPANFDVVTIDFSVVDVFYLQDFEPCDGSFALTTDWECGPVTDGPPTCHSGANCLGTNLYSGDRTWGSTTATSPTIDLSGAVNPQLRYWFWQDVESGWDGTRLELSVDGGPWTLLQTSLPYEGNLAGLVCWDNDYTTWIEVQADLSPYVGQTVAFRWSLRSDSIIEYDGPFVDDVVISTE